MVPLSFINTFQFPCDYHVTDHCWTENQENCRISILIDPYAYLGILSVILSQYAQCNTETLKFPVGLLPIRGGWKHNNYVVCVRFKYVKNANYRSYAQPPITGIQARF